MASLRSLRQLLRSAAAVWTTPEGRRIARAAAVGSVASTAAIYYLYSSRPVAHAAATAIRSEPNPDLSSVKKLSSREQRFLRFASVEYNGQIFMTPRDFIDSLTQEQPRSRLSRRVLSNERVKKILRKTPPLRKGSKRLFRDLDHHGLVSYTEYLFLLSVLTKPQAGFRIAFNMFDMDGNEMVDKQEFLVLENLMSRSRLVKSTKSQANEPITIECEQDKSDPVGNSLRAAEEKAQTQDTTLLLHLFGLRGKAMMSFEDFKQYASTLYSFMLFSLFHFRFHDNLLEELLEIEFEEFSKGRMSISEMDFAKILLRYTLVNPEDYNKYMQRIHGRIQEEQGISYEQFRDFCLFLNDFDDFTIAVKLYTLSDLPVSQAEFSRAVRCATGYALDPHVVDTVFKIFDVNDNGELCYSEFISIMKDRIHRGFKSHSKKRGGSGWNGFKQCVSQELKTY
uniref:EF-hand domain-containing protein n=1 Tax=Plectus sambesii TaxID=2011161 RepID=A0A914VXI1_9BILA